MECRSRRAWTPTTDRDYIRNSITAASAPTRATLRLFALWLEHDRGLVLGTIVGRIRSARWFVEAACTRARVSGARALRSVTARHVEDFFIDYVKGKGPVARQSMQSAMRLLLRFAASRGWVDEGLSAAVPSLRQYRLAKVPRALPDNEFQHLLDATRTRTISARDQAIVWLLACYGVRCGQVSALRLEDVDWRARTIVFRAHKRGKAIRHELLPVVADALVHYLRTERPGGGDDEFIFVRTRAPHLRSSPGAIAHALRRCMARASLHPRGPHSLRHSFASRLLRFGESLKTIADLLGHRSLGAVAIYAKVDRPRLLEVAVEWPEVRS
jgi:integrase/recombinase XerD